LKIRLHSLALDDIEKGRHFYERQQAGLGDYFLDSLFSDIDSLLLYAGIHQKVAWPAPNPVLAFSDMAIYYRVEGADIQVCR
jgi:hypothetical protein